MAYSLYTRKEYEEDCARIDAQIAVSAMLLGEQLIGPLDHWQRCKVLEECKRRLGMRLAMTAMSIVDKKRTGKSPLFAWVIGAQKDHEKNCPRKLKTGFHCNCSGPWFTTRRNPVLKHVQITGNRWTVTNVEQIERLESQGITVVESFFQKRKGKADEASELGAELLKWEEVTEERARELQNEGHFEVRQHPVTGKSEDLWRAHWMIRAEGEPDAEGKGVKFFAANIE